MTPDELAGHFCRQWTNIRRLLIPARIKPRDGKYKLADVARCLEGAAARDSRNAGKAKPGEPETHKDRKQRLEADILQLRVDEIKARAVPYEDYIADVEDFADRMVTGLQRVEQAMGILLRDKVQMDIVKREIDAVRQSLADAEKAAKWRGKRQSKQTEELKDDGPAET